MNETRERVIGRCPGALDPLETGDGLMIRVRPRLGRLSLVQLEALAQAAQRFGDGRLYLSNRANVHIRGVASESHAAALGILAAVNLVDSDARIEAVRNVMLLPRVGAQAFALAEGLAAKLEAALAKTEPLHGLPGKFGAAIQTGRELDNSGIGDVTFLVRNDGIAMLLEGDLHRATVFSGTQQAVDGFVSVALVFLGLRQANPSIRRMRDAVAQFGSEAVANRAGLSTIKHDYPLIAAPPPVGDLGEAFGLGFAFGEIRPEPLNALTRLMREKCVAEAEISPHRALIFPVRDAEKAAFQAFAAEIKAIVSPNDLRLRVHACPGARACSRGTVAARRDAESVLAALSETIPPKGIVHISGCGKRCAFPRKADITAIGVDGSYTLTAPGGAVQTGVAASELARAVSDYASAL